MKTIERKERTRPCYCPRDRWSSRICGHVNGIRETYWVIVENGVTLSDPFRTKREAQAEIDKETS